MDTTILVRIVDFSYTRLVQQEIFFGKKIQEKPCRIVDSLYEEWEAIAKIEKVQRAHDRGRGSVCTISPKTANL